MSASLREVTLGVAIGDARGKVREDGTNKGRRITEALKNAGIDVSAAWCVAIVQLWADDAAAILRVPNPLDEVKLEALVASYLDWAVANRRVVAPEKALPGDLVIYKFTTGNHAGLLIDTPAADGTFRAVEGNTNAAGSREGDGVYEKDRGTNKGYSVTFVRWTP